METLPIILKDEYIKDPHWNRFTIQILKYSAGDAVRKSLQDNETNRLIQIILGNPFDCSTTQKYKFNNNIYIVILLIVIFLVRH